MEKFKEKHSRTIAKVISWRVLLTISHIVNGFLATGSLLVGLQIAGWATVINSFLYWSHERLWDYFKFLRKKDPDKNFDEIEGRSLLKVITWRILITFSNFFIPFLVTGSWGSAAIFAGLATVVNIILYYTHERIWNYIPWAKVVVNTVDPSIKKA